MDNFRSRDSGYYEVDWDDKLHKDGELHRKPGDPIPDVDKLTLDIIPEVEEEELTEETNKEENNG